jgi:hypothetical protein
MTSRILRITMRDLVDYLETGEFRRKCCVFGNNTIVRLKVIDEDIRFTLGTVRILDRKILKGGPTDRRFVFRIEFIRRNY